MNKELLLPVICISVLVILVIAVSSYQKLLNNWYGIIGPGGAYMSVVGIISTVWLIIGLVHGEAEAGSLIAMAVMALIGLAFLVVAEFRCRSVFQHIWLPIACIFMAFGFSFHLMLRFGAGKPMPTVDVEALELEQELEMEMEQEQEQEQY